MKFKFFNIPAIFSEDATNELDKFCASHKVTDVEKQFVSHGNESFWSFCVTYLDDKATNVTASEKKEGIDYRVFQNSILEHSLETRVSRQSLSVRNRVSTLNSQRNLAAILCG